MSQLEHYCQLKNDVDQKIRRHTKLNELYRATKYNFDLGKFHELCDKKGPTLTVLEGRSVLFGGYTTKSWQSTEYMYSRKQSDPDAFLFCLEKQIQSKTVFFEGQNPTITCYKGYGPTFGGGKWAAYDLQVISSQNTHTEMDTDYKKLSGSINFNSVYCNGGYNKQPNGGELNVKEMVVYQVVDQEPDKWFKKTTKEQMMSQIKEQLHGNIDGMYNILLVGPIGAGKSSFCNSMSTACKNEIVGAAIDANSLSSGSVTYKYRAYPLSIEDERCAVRLFDTRGIDANWNYNRYIGAMLNGTLPDGYEFKDLAPEQEEGYATAHFSESNRIHVVAIIANAAQVAVYPNELKKAIHEVAAYVHQHELQCVVIATHFDEYKIYLKKHPGAIYEWPGTSEKIKQIAELMGVKTNFVIPFINYTTEEKPSEDLDKIVLSALTTLVKTANEYQRKKQKPAERKRSTLNDVKKTLTTKNNRVQILCVGKSFAGKSTFIDSIKTVLEREKSTKATKGFATKHVGSDTPTTSKVKRFPLKMLDFNNECVNTNACIVDMPGFTEEGSISFEKIKWTIEGHVKNNAELVNEFSETSDSFVKTPHMKDRMHVVCIVMDHESASDNAPTWEIKMIQKILKWITDADIPYVIVITKMDTVSKVDEAVLTVVKTLGVMKPCIFPVRNYIHEDNLDDGIDNDLCGALNYILKEGYEYLEDNEDED